VNILLVDDHAILRAGLRKLLSSVFDGAVYEAANGREAVALALTKKLDLILLDLNLPELGGLELLERLLQVSQAAVLVLSMHAEPFYVTRTLEAGAQGYISKAAPPEELLNAIRKVTAGGRYIEAELAQMLAAQPDAPGAPSLEQLSSRDMELLRLLGAGRTLSEIAEALGLSYKTVANTCSAMKVKLGVARTADLVRLAVQANLA
jgi:two-component system, NarL family, invasion response regulator UvrY